MSFFTNRESTLEAMPLLVDMAGMPAGNICSDLGDDTGSLKNVILKNQMFALSLKAISVKTLVLKCCKSLQHVVI